MRLKMVKGNSKKIFPTLTKQKKKNTKENENKKKMCKFAKS